ncbi:sigma-54-dependent transcriptional regulator [Trichloromonas sp.]|uniref:sigma-54-dependent transcriptional regulator n=1 Tax=Trichloromonas sp. TaxID=3069249 RepID=UPI003D8140FB
MKQMKILVSEDGDSQRTMLCAALGEEGFEVSEARSAEEALSLMKTDFFDLLITDYKMSGMNGLELLEAVKRRTPETDVIMMTAFGTVETAIQALKLGAVDYITKPLELEELLLQIGRIGRNRALTRENELLRKNLAEKGIASKQIIYQSEAMGRAINLASRVAASDATVLIEGESGTGKELIARLIHQLSPRSSQPRVTVNCMALPETLLESELFGHEKGAFTGATQSRIGRFEEADGSTLFLDEIGDLSPAIQVKLLRFLQEHEFQRLGSNRTLHSDARIITATNRSLPECISKGTFREDLYYRLNVVSIRLPSLRERKEDLPLLTEHFLKKSANRYRKQVVEFSAEARDQLMAYDYPGNVRELENIIERAVVITDGPVVTPAELPFHSGGAEFQPNPVSSDGTLGAAVERVERQMIRQALREHKNNKSRAAEQLGISERVLRYKVKRLKL